MSRTRAGAARSHPGTRVVRAPGALPPCGATYAARVRLSDSARRSTDRTSQEEER
jgi:hypothetical protein